MRILFDVNVPEPFRRYLTEHIVDTAEGKGWARIRNGDLLDNAERGGYEILITADQSMRYQQNMAHRQIAVIVLLSNRWPRVQLRIEDIRAALDGMKPGEVREVSA
ncbi:MAG: hypothetical protein OXR67_15570 [Chloroflexota bacterium]|nr:hypothetical protein [Chloroflexota bacterium]